MVKAKGRKLTQYGAETPEAERIDPAEFLETAMNANKAETPVKPQTDEDLLATLELMDKPPAYTPPVKQEEEQKPPVEMVEEPDDVQVDDSLIGRLSEKYGLKKETLREKTIIVNGQKMVLSLRPRHYDHIIWALGVMQDRITNNVDTAYLQTGLQRDTYTQHLTDCCTVIKIDGEYVWDIFPFRDHILASSPGWDGKSYSAIPDMVQSSLQLRVHDWFRSLDPNALFNLKDAVAEAYPDPEDPDAGEVEEGPTSAT